MSLCSGIFFMRAATVAGLGNSILPVPPKNLMRSSGISTMASSWGFIFFGALSNIRTREFCRGGSFQSKKKRPWAKNCK